MSESAQTNTERLRRFVKKAIECFLSGAARDPDDDNAVGVAVRKLGPRPRGQAGASAKPEEPFFE